MKNGVNGKMKTVSIVVPVFNAEKYLEKCLDSIVQQTFIDYEIILVDDGSTDSSASICKKYEKLYDRIRYLRTDNFGVGAARNKGICLSEGEYICFIDSDDYILPDYLEKMYTKVKKDRLDCVCCGAVYETSNGCEEKHHKYGDCIFTRRGEIQAEIIEPLLGEGDNTGLSSCCNKLYRTEILRTKSIFQDERLTFAEDWLFNIRFFMSAKRIGFINSCLYVYVRHQLSLSTSFKSTDVLNSVYISENLREWFPDRYKDFDRNKELVKTQRWSIQRAGRVGG